MNNAKGSLYFIDPTRSTSDSDASDNQVLIKYKCSNCDYRWSSDWTEQCFKCGSYNIRQMPVIK